MFKYTKVILILCCLVMTGCGSMFETASKNNFDTNPFKYWQAEVTKQVQLPVYISSNIDHEPLYPIPLEKKLNGEVRANKAPPTLVEKITDLDT